MIKVKFSELKINDEFFALSDKEGCLPMNKVSNNSFYCMGNETKTEDCEVLMSPKFKDRYGKDLSIGDRVLILEIVGNWDHKLNEIQIKDVSLDLTFEYIYLITDMNSKIHQLVSNDIVKIEKDWNI